MLKTVDLFSCCKFWANVRKEFSLLGNSSITQLVLTHYMWNKDLDDSLQVNANVTLEYEGRC